MKNVKVGFGKRALALFCFVALCMVIFIVLFNLAGGIDVGKRYRFAAVVPSALQLTDNADVKQAGVTIGKVTDISERGTTAVIAMAIDPDRGPVHRNGSVRVRAKTLVGENYVEVVPGGPPSPELPDGGELPIESTKPSVQFDEILSAIGPKRRLHLRHLLSGLGEGVSDADAVNRTMGGLADTFISGAKVADALVVEREALADLVTDFGIAFRALGEQRAAIEGLVRGARGAATAVANQDQALRAALRELPPTLVQTEATTRHLAAVGNRAGPVLDDLTSALVTLSPVARDLPAAATATLGALRRLENASPEARELLVSLRRLAEPATRMVPRLDRFLRELRPALEYVRPYSKDIASFFAATGQAVGAHDELGYAARVRAVVTSNLLVQFGEAERNALEELLALGAAKLINFRGYDALPDPNTLATPSPFEGSYPRVERDAP